MIASVPARQEKNLAVCWVKTNLEMLLFSSLLTNRYERKMMMENYNSISAIHMSLLYLMVS